MMDYISHYLKDNEIMDYRTQQGFHYDIDSYRFRLIKRFLSKMKEGPFIDIGSGSGRFINDAQREFFSLDISQKNNSSNAIKIEGDILHAPFRSGSFSLITLSQILEHTSSPEDVVSEMSRILKPGGILLITVPFNEHIKKHLCIHCNNLTPENAHLHSFDIEKLSSIAQEAGLNLLSAHPFENRLLYTLHFFSVFKNMPIDIINFIDIFVGNWYNKFNKLFFIAEKRASGSVGRAHPSQG